MNIYTKSALVLFAGSMPSLAEIKMPTFFSDGMVLQRETSAKVWGSVDAGAGVKVRFAGKELETKAGGDGKWMIDFKGLKMSKSGAVMTITSGEDKLEIKDVLVGEVWLASGQSNMEWPMKRTSSAEEAKTANDPLLRVYVSGNKTAKEPVADFKGVWRHTHPDHNSGFTAVGYEFAKNLRKKLDVPVGIIECSWGGKPVESFVSEEALKALPEAKFVIDKKVNMQKKWDASDKKKKRGNPALHPAMHSTIYNGMIAPLVGYGVRGAIWYQGESNARGATSDHYGELLHCLINDWRTRWGVDFSFYYVQLANFNGPRFTGWVTVQDEMRRLLDESKGTGMAVINDIGAAKDIHPKNKKDVGERLSRWALVRDYGQKDIIVSGPLYKGHVVKGASIEITFVHGEGMKSRDGKPLGGFEVSDASGQWHAADAVIKDGKVLVTHKDVSKPVNARYAWQNNPVNANLVNAAGLPTSCFIGM